MAGDSGTPLPTKLGITEGCTVVLLGAPSAGGSDPGGVLGPLPGSVTVRYQARGRADVVVAFFTERRAFERRVEALGRLVFPDGGLWVAWPKRAAKVPTTMTEDVVRQVALPLGLVDNKVCAIDETWTGLRLVWRRELRRGASG